MRQVVPMGLSNPRLSLEWGFRQRRRLGERFPWRLLRQDSPLAPSNWCAVWIFWDSRLLTMCYSSFWKPSFWQCTVVLLFPVLTFPYKNHNPFHTLTLHSDRPYGEIYLTMPLWNLKTIVQKSSLHLFFSAVDIDVPDRQWFNHTSKLTINIFNSSRRQREEGGDDSKLGSCDMWLYSLFWTSVFHVLLESRLQFWGRM